MLVADLNKIEEISEISLVLTKIDKPRHVVTLLQSICVKSILTVARASVHDEGGWVVGSTVLLFQDTVDIMAGQVTADELAKVVALRTVFHNRQPMSDAEVAERLAKELHTDGDFARSLEVF